MSWFAFYLRAAGAAGLIGLVGTLTTFRIIAKVVPDDEWRRFAYWAMPAALVVGTLSMAGAVVVGLIWPPGWI